MKNKIIEYCSKKIEELDKDEYRDELFYEGKISAFRNVIDFIEDELSDQSIQS
jgi:hypothetical protein